MIKEQERVTHRHTSASVEVTLSCISLGGRVSRQQVRVGLERRYWVWLSPHNEFINTMN